MQGAAAQCRGLQIGPAAAGSQRRGSARAGCAQRRQACTAALLQGPAECSRSVGQLGSRDGCRITLFASSGLLPTPRRPRRAARDAPGLIPCLCVSLCMPLVIGTLERRRDGDGDVGLRTTEARTLGIALSRSLLLCPCGRQRHERQRQVPSLRCATRRLLRGDRGRPKENAIVGDLSRTSPANLLCSTPSDHCRLAARLLPWTCCSGLRREDKKQKTILAARKCLQLRSHCWRQ